MIKHHFFIRNILDRPIVKLFLYIFLFLALGITSLYFQSMFFPDFSWISIAHCVDANHLALNTITPSPIEVLDPLSDQTREYDSDDLLESSNELYRQALRKEKKSICIGFVTFAVPCFVVAFGLITCAFLGGIRKIC